MPIPHVLPLTLLLPSILLNRLEALQIQNMKCNQLIDENFKMARKTEIPVYVDRVKMTNEKRRQKIEIVNIESYRIWASSRFIRPF